MEMKRERDRNTGEIKRERDRKTEGDREGEIGRLREIERERD